MKISFIIEMFLELLKDFREDIQESQRGGCLGLNGHI